jgi:hypothetical protein
VYIVGERHGNQETKQLFQIYLRSLHQKAGVRDVVLEEHQAYEPDANAYVLGRMDMLPEELCRRADILGLIREFNATLSEDEKVKVHLVDVDSPLPVIYKHLTDLHVRLGSKGASIQIPPLSELETWGPKSSYDLIADLQSAAADQPDILKELETLRLSFRWYFGGDELDSNTWATKNFMPLREEIITQNIRNIIACTNGRPIFAFFGARHAEKGEADPTPRIVLRSWAEQLNESGMDIYSLSVEGMAGNGYWRGESYQYEELWSQYQLSDGSLLPSLFESHPGASIIFTDLRADENQNIKLPAGALDISASQLIDGLVLYKEFTPMENACPSGLD